MSTRSLHVHGMRCFGSAFAADKEDSFLVLLSGILCSDERLTALRACNSSSYIEYLLCCIPRWNWLLQIALRQTSLSGIQRLEKVRRSSKKCTAIKERGRRNSNNKNILLREYKQRQPTKRKHYTSTSTGASYCSCTIDLLATSTPSSSITGWLIDWLTDWLSFLLVSACLQYMWRRSQTLHEPSYIVQYSSNWRKHHYNLHTNSHIYTQYTHIILYHVGQLFFFFFFLLLFW
jgi:hypothetical protein